VDPVLGRFQARELGRPLDPGAVLGQTLLEDPLGLGLKEREHEVVAMRHPRKLDRRKPAPVAAQGEAPNPEAGREQALGDPRGLQQLERARVDAERFGVLGAGRVPVDDPHRAAQARKLERGGEPGRPGADHEDGSIVRAGHRGTLKAGSAFSSAPNARSTES
jgi:hypothetical protein